MGNVLLSLATALHSGLRTRAALYAEILALRHQLAVPQRTNCKLVHLRAADRLLWVWLSQLWSGWRRSLVIVKPETVLAWHRKGFRLYRGGAPRPRKGGQ